MSYEYDKTRPGLFTEEGQVMFVKIRDRAFEILRTSSCFMMGDVISAVSSGDTWLRLACVDRMVELGDVVEITGNADVAAQHRVFMRVR